jgi:TatD DNase family protein
MTDLALGLPDTHAHLSHVAELHGDAFLEVLALSYQGQSAFILDPGIEYNDFPARQALLGRFPFIHLAAGIWPDADSLADCTERLAQLEKHISTPACVAVGECGLDYHWMNGTKEQQLFLFNAQMDLAVIHDKPLIVHSRLAHQDTLKAIRRVSGKVAVIIHCFSYDEPAVREYLAAGCYISFAGNITYKKSLDIRAACSAVPDNRLLLETDAPYMNPEPLRGKNSSPLDISRTYLAVSGLRGSNLLSLPPVILKNTRSVFKI